MAGQGRQQPCSRSQSQSQEYQHQHQQQPDPIARTTTTNANGKAKDPDSSSSPSKPKLRTSCDGCQEAKLGCSQEKPTCRRCLRHGTTCVYSPFRRIGRPRKSTHSRSNTTAKSRSKNNSVDEKLFASPIECLQDADNNGQTGGITPFDTLIAPPTSPASTENECGPWYPWSSDGNSLSTMNIDTSANFMEGLDPFSSSSDYLDLDSCFDMDHNMLMGYPMHTANDTPMEMKSSMQPTPPSSISDEMSVFGEAMTRSPTRKPVDMISNRSIHQQRNIKKTSSSTHFPALKLETPYSANTGLDDLQSNSFPSLNSRSVKLPTTRNDLTNNHTFGPTPELSPPLSVKSPPGSPCSNHCSSTLIQQLASLSKHLSDNVRPSLDKILHVERDTSSFCRRILTCKPCIDNKSNLLLFSMVVDQIMRLFETVRDEGASERCSLLVGNFEVDDRSAKTEVLQRLLLSRLTDLGGMLEESSQTIDESSTDSNANAATEMLGSVRQRLDSLRGGIEAWD